MKTVGKVQATLPNFVLCFLWVWNLVSYIKGRTFYIDRDHLKNACIENVDLK